MLLIPDGSLLDSEEKLQYLEATRLCQQDICLLANAAWPETFLLARPELHPTWDSPVPHCCSFSVCLGLLHYAALHHLCLPLEIKRLENKNLLMMRSFNKHLIQIEKASGVGCKMFAFKWPIKVWDAFSKSDLERNLSSISHFQMA